jgi:hypothetical protein
MKMWIGNIDPEASDQDLRDFLAKYCAATLGGIEREPGDGTRPAAVVDFPGSAGEEVREFQRRLHGMFWRGRTINVQVF